MQINVYSHGFEISSVREVRERSVIHEFCKPLIQYELKKVRGKFVRAPSRVYAFATKDQTKFRFHANQLSEFLDLLARKGFKEKEDYTVKHHELEVNDFPIVGFKWKSPKLPRENQLPIIDLALAPGVCKMIGAEPGFGKELAVSTLVRIPGGWKRMGNVEVGDLVIGRDGKPTNVTGVYPQGEKQLYKVTFYDGRSVFAGLEHQWQVFNARIHDKEKRWGVLNTEQMIDILNRPEDRLYIPLMEPESTEHRDLPIDPYLLGVLLGDGGLTSEQLYLSNPEPEIIEKVISLLPKGQELVKVKGDNCDYRINAGKSGVNQLKKDLEWLKLLGCYSHEKFIPNVYKESSIEQRKELLKGLMDTDGHVVKGGSLTYSTSSQKLMEGVQYLVRSLGGMAYVSKKIPAYTHNGEKRIGKLSYTLTIRLPKPSDIVSLPRKLGRVNDDNQYSHRLKLRVVSIEKAHVEEAVCISVDNDDKLYVVEDFIVTHNTLIALWVGKELGLRSVYMFKGGYVARWVEAFEEYYDLEPGELCVVRGSAMLINLMEDALNGAVLPKIIVLTNRTMSDYLKDYRETNGRSKTYPIKPGDLFKKLGIGYVVKDELHQEFHFNYRMDLFTHTLKTLSLSGTLESTDQFMERIYDIGYPVVERIFGGATDPYIAVTALMYDLEHPGRAKYMGPMGYSHNKYESYLMASGNKKLLTNYLDMFVWVTKVYYDSIMNPGQKMLHFCSSVEMCLLVRDYLRRAFPHYVINKYTEEDNYEVLLESDITVSTVLSAGTAVDVPGLLTTFMSIGIDSIKSNKQALGRTRRFADGTQPNFIYAVCVAIQKQLDYHYNKRGYFQGKVVSHKERQYYHKV